MGKHFFFLERKVMKNLDSILKSRDITLLTKVHLVKATGFPVVTYGCESWTIKKAECWRTDAFELWCWRRLLRVPWIARSNQSILKEVSPEYSLERLMLKLKHQLPVVKNWCFQTFVLEKPLENHLDCKIKPVNPKGNQPWMFTGRTHAEGETPILRQPDAESWLIWKDPDAGKDWGQEEKGMTEDEMVGWHHRLNGHEFGWTPGAGDGQGGLTCYGSWGHKESDTPERLNWTELNVCILDLFLSFNFLLDYMIIFEAGCL